MRNLAELLAAARPVNATAAGTTAINGTHVDMQGFDGVVFVCLMGTLTATQVTALKAQGGALANDSDMADLVGAATPAAADADSNKLLILDVYRPQQRYVRPVVTRGTANAVIDGVLAFRYQGEKVPIAIDATLVSQQKLVASP
jgi:hypothetical protein